MLTYWLAAGDLFLVVFAGWLTLKLADAQQRADVYRRRLEQAEVSLAAMFRPETVSRPVDEPPAVS